MRTAGDLECRDQGSEVWYILYRFAEEEEVRVIDADILVTDFFVKDLESLGDWIDGWTLEPSL